MGRPSPGVGVGQVPGRLGLASPVLDLVPQRERLLEAGDALAVARGPQGQAEVVQHPRLTLAVPRLPGTVQRHAMAGDAVRPGAPAVEDEEEGHGQPPGDVMPTGRRGLAGRGQHVGTLTVVPGQGILRAGEGERLGIRARGIERHVVPGPRRDRRACRVGGTHVPAEEPAHGGLTLCLRQVSHGPFRGINAKQVMELVPVRGSRPQ